MEESILLDDLNATKFNDPENMEMLNKGFVNKLHPVELDLRNHRIALNVQASKRTDKITKLYVEQFRFDIYNRNEKVAF